MFITRETFLPARCLQAGLDTRVARDKIRAFMYHPSLTLVQVRLNHIFPFLLKKKKIPFK